MSSVAMEFDYADILPTVRRAHSRASIDDAEEAISVACVELLAKGTPLTGANVVTRARSRLIDSFSRREASNSSLDAALEEDVDHAPRELAIDVVNFDAHATLREITDNPIMFRKLRAVQRGARVAMLIPRGTASGQCKYSDSAVEEVRRLRSERGLFYKDIAAEVGIPLRTVETWCRREKRCCPSMSGWDRDLILLAIKTFTVEEARRPTSADVHSGDPRLPSFQTVERHFGSWSAALEAVGVQRSEQGQARYWTDERVKEAIEGFVEREGRMPRWKDWRRKGMPGSAKLHKFYGTQRAEKILDAIAA